VAAAIESYAPEHASAVSDAYNSAVRGIPHCYPVTAEKLAASLYTDDRLQDEKIWVATAGEAVHGFLHAAVERPCEKIESPRGIIRLLLYERGHREVGQALLNEAEKQLRQSGMGRIEAFPQEYRYPFYHLKAAYLSDRLDHIEALLRFNGYQRIRGEVFLNRPGFVPQPPGDPPVAVDISLDWTDGKGRLPGLHVRAHHEGKQVGECISVSCGEYTDAEEAQDGLFTTWLGVDDVFRGKKLGVYLLERSLEELHEIGYRHAVISTAWDNSRAFLFYSNHGYHVVDWTYGLARKLA